MRLQLGAIERCDRRASQAVKNIILPHLSGEAHDIRHKTSKILLLYIIRLDTLTYLWHVYSKMDKDTIHAFGSRDSKPLHKLGIAGRVFQIKPYRKNEEGPNLLMSKIKERQHFEQFKVMIFSL